MMKMPWIIKGNNRGNRRPAKSPASKRTVSIGYGYVIFFWLGGSASSPPRKYTRLHHPRPRFAGAGAGAAGAWRRQGASWNLISLREVRGAKPPGQEPPSTRLRPTKPEVTPVRHGALQKSCFECHFGREGHCVEHLGFFDRTSPGSVDSNAEGRSRVAGVGSCGEAPDAAHLRLLRARGVRWPAVPLSKLLLHPRTLSPVLNLLLATAGVRPPVCCLGRHRQKC